MTPHACSGALLWALIIAGCSSDPAPRPPPRAEPTTPSIAPSVAAPVVEPTVVEPTVVEPPAEPAHPSFSRASPDERRSTAGLLRRGRAASRSGDRAGALALFREGLALEPGDPHLLCEAGWAAFQLDDPEAATYLAAGAAVPSAPAVRGACLYNLGRLHERWAERTSGAERERLERAAAQAYGESLAIRPGNAETRRRYEALPEAARAPTYCPPTGAFADDDALCAALAAWDPEVEEPDELECVRVERALRLEGTGPELIALQVTDAAVNWDTYFLVSRTPAGLRPLAVLGHGWDRSCSWGAVQATSARWSGEGDATVLEVELHEVGEYDCAPSPYDECLEQAERDGTDASGCDGLSETSTETTDARYRIFCRGAPEELRCSIVGPALGEHRPWATPGPLPEGDALERALECPPR